MLTVELVRRAGQEGISKDAIKQARKDLKVQRAKRGGVWWVALPGVQGPEPVRPPEPPPKGRLSMGQLLQRAGLDDDGRAAEFEQWLSPAATEAKGELFTAGRRAMILGCVAAHGNLQMGAHLTGICARTAERWVKRGKADSDARLKALEDGKETTATEYENFLWDYLRAAGWLGGKLLAVIYEKALGRPGDPRGGDPKWAAWALERQHGLHARLEIDMDPAIGLDSVDARRERFRLRIADMRANREALEREPSESEE